MNTSAIDHVAIVVADLEATLRTYVNALGFRQIYRETIPERDVEVVGLVAGDSTIELVRPLNPHSPVARYLGGAASKLHHVGYRVDDIERELARLRSSGVRLIDEKPQRGAHGLRVAFLDPKTTDGVLIELCQSQRKSDGVQGRSAVVGGSSYQPPAEDQMRNMMPLMVVATVVAGLTIGWALSSATKT